MQTLYFAAMVSIFFSLAYSQRSLIGYLPYFYTADAGLLVESYRINFFIDQREIWHATEPMICSFVQNFILIGASCRPYGQKPKMHFWVIYKKASIRWQDSGSPISGYWPTSELNAG